MSSNLPHNNSTQCSVAAVQMVSTPNLEENLQQAEALIASAVSGGAKFILLPENFAVFDAKQLYALRQQQGNGEIWQTVAGWAKHFSVWIVAGTLPMGNRFPQGEEPVANQKVRTSSLVFNPQGEQQYRYDKIHLFDVDVADAQGAYRESEYIEPGEQVCVAEINDGSLPAFRLGLSVCYDLRFPELYRQMAALGATVFTVPAAFTWRTGQAHWETLIRARAIENQCYIIAANQGGKHSEKRQTWGQSMIVDPWGDILSQHATGPGVVLADLDFHRLEALRQNMPVHQHRKL